MSSITGITNPFPGLGPQDFVLSKAALSMKYVTGYSGGNPVYSPGFAPLGSAETVELGLVPTYAIGMKTDTGVSVESVRALSKIGVTGTLTLLQSSPLITAASILSADVGRTYTQEAQSATTSTLTGAVPFMEYRLGAKNVTVTGVTWGVNGSSTAIALVLGQDYYVDQANGEVYLNAKPAGWVSGDPVVSWSATQITAAMNYASMGAFTSGGMQGILKAKGVGIQGQQKLWMIWSTLLAPNGAKSIHNSGTDMDKTTMDFSMFPATVDDLGNPLSVNDQFLNATDI